MIVLDTSAAIELLLKLPKSALVVEQLDKFGWQIAAPELLTIESLQVLRRRVANGLTNLVSAEEALELLNLINISYYEHQMLADRIWELKDNLTAYDATFVALAEALNAVLLTADERMANAPGINADIIVI